MLSATDGAASRYNDRNPASLFRLRWKRLDEFDDSVEHDYDPRYNPIAAGRTTKAPSCVAILEAELSARQGSGAVGYGLW